MKVPEGIKTISAALEKDITHESRDKLKRILSDKVFAKRIINIFYN